MDVGQHMYSTHLEGLLHACFRTPGPILELGTGEFSTPLLRLVFPNRQIVSVENHEDWFEKMKLKLGELKSNQEYMYVPDWTHVYKFSSCRWGVVFIDIDPVRERLPLASLFATSADIVVMHDTESSQVQDFSKLFKSVINFRDTEPWTTLGSNIVSRDWLMTGLPTGD